MWVQVPSHAPFSIMSRFFGRLLILTSSVKGDIIQPRQGEIIMNFDINQINSVIFFLQNIKKLFSIIVKSTVLHFR